MNVHLTSQKKPRRVHLESDDEEAEEVASVDTMRSASSMRRGGKRMDMIRPHLTQQQQEAVDEEGLYSESDQEVETQSRSSAMQVCGQSLSAILIIIVFCVGGSKGSTVL